MLAGWWRTPSPRRERVPPTVVSRRKPGAVLPAGLFLAFWLLAAAAALAQAKFDATLERNPISLGESATLTMTVENGSLQSRSQSAARCRACNTAAPASKRRCSSMARR